MNSLDKSYRHLNEVLKFIKNKEMIETIFRTSTFNPAGRECADVMLCGVVWCVCYISNSGPCCRIQLPDLRYIDCTVDFSVKTFNASVGMCKDLALRHPEELSLCKPLDPEHLRQNYQVIMTPLSRNFVRKN